MGRKSVAVLDIRSSEVAVFVGERGVNNTYAFKGSRTEPYYGYEKGAFYNTEELKTAILRAINAVEQICGERIRTLYVGVPGEFTLVDTRQQDISFPKKRKVTGKDIDTLLESGKETIKDYRFMRATSMIYVTADDRRVVDPVGISTLGLTGAISYFYCAEYFCSVIEEILGGLKIETHYLPTQFAMAFYLIPSETRDECAIFFDAGYLSSTVSIVLGGGILAQHTFWAGKGQIVGLIMEKFRMPVDAALALLGRANLYSKGDRARTEFYYRGVSYEYTQDELSEAVRDGLDSICEELNSFLEGTDRELDYKPLYVSGEGLTDMRGALDHVARRLNRVTEQVAPDLPYYNKPAMSSRIALVDMAYEDNRKSGFLYRIFGIGGN